MIYVVNTQNLGAGSGEQPLPQLHMQRLYQYLPIDSVPCSYGLPLLALPLFRVVYVDTDAENIKGLPLIKFYQGM